MAKQIPVENTRTACDPHGVHVNAAIDLLAHAKRLREYRARLVQRSTAEYGWQGPLISGCEQEHWPTDVKDTLRANARAIAVTLDASIVEWRKAGRALHTWRRVHQERFIVAGSRY